MGYLISIAQWSEYNHQDMFWYATSITVAVWICTCWTLPHTPVVYDTAYLTIEASAVRKNGSFLRITCSGRINDDVPIGIYTLYEGNGGLFRVPYVYLASNSTDYRKPNSTMRRSVMEWIIWIAGFAEWSFMHLRGDNEGIYY